MTELKGKVYIPGPSDAPELNYEGEHYHTFEEMIEARPDVWEDRPVGVSYHVVDPEEYETHIQSVKVV